MRARAGVRAGRAGRAIADWEEGGRTRRVGSWSRTGQFGRRRTVNGHPGPQNVTRLSTTRTHARPTRHHGVFKYWPRRSPSASRGGRPGSPCGPTLPSRTVGSSRGGTTRRRAVRRSRAHDGPCPTFWRRGRPHFRSSAALIGLRGGRRSRWATIQCDAAIEMGDSQRTPRNRGVRVRWGSTTTDDRSTPLPSRQRPEPGR